MSKPKLALLVGPPLIGGSASSGASQVRDEFGIDFLKSLDAHSVALLPVLLNPPTLADGLPRHQFFGSWHET